MMRENYGENYIFVVCGFAIFIFYRIVSLIYIYYPMYIYHNFIIILYKLLFQPCSCALVSQIYFYLFDFI